MGSLEAELIGYDQPPDVIAVGRPSAPPPRMSAPAPRISAPPPRISAPPLPLVTTRSLPPAIATATATRPLPRPSIAGSSRAPGRVRLAPIQWVAIGAAVLLCFAVLVLSFAPRSGVRSRPLAGTPEATFEVVEPTAVVEEVEPALAAPAEIPTPPVEAALDPEPITVPAEVIPAAEAPKPARRLRPPKNAPALAKPDETEASAPALAPPPAPEPPAAEPAPSPPPSGGTLVVNVLPWGNVFIDGENLGYPPVVAEGLTPGAHSVRVERAGYETVEQVVEVAAGAEQRLHLKLNKRTH
jgi:hypothetical protein